MERRRRPPLPRRGIATAKRATRTAGSWTKSLPAPADPARSQPPLEPALGWSFGVAGACVIAELRSAPMRLDENS